MRNVRSRVAYPGLSILVTVGLSFAASLLSPAVATADEAVSSGSGLSASALLSTPVVQERSLYASEILSGPFVAAKTIVVGGKTGVLVKYWGDGNGLVRSRFVEQNKAGKATITVTNMVSGDICRRSTYGDNGVREDRNAAWSCEKTPAGVNPLSMFLPETYVSSVVGKDPSSLFSWKMSESSFDSVGIGLLISQTLLDGSVASTLDSFVNATGEYNAQVVQPGVKTYLQSSPDSSVVLVPWNQMDKEYS